MSKFRNTVIAFLALASVSMAGSFGFGTNRNIAAMSYKITNVNYYASAIYYGTNPVWSLQPTPIYACSFNGVDDYVDTGLSFTGGYHVEFRLEAQIRGGSDNSFDYYAATFTTSDSPWFGVWKNTTARAGFFGYAATVTTFPVEDGWHFFKVSKFGGEYDGVAYNFEVESGETPVVCPVMIGVANNSCVPWGATFAKLDVTRWQIVTNEVLAQDCKAQSNGSFRDSVTGATISRGGGGSMTTIDVTATNLPPRSWY